MNFLFVCLLLLFFFGGGGGRGGGKGEGGNFKVNQLHSACSKHS